MRTLFAKRFFLTVIVLLFMAAALEILSRLYLGAVLHKSPERKFQFDSYRIYANRPGFREGDGRRDWIVHNSQGFRRTEPVIKEKPAGVFRVFLLGGSAAAGVSSAPPYPVRHLYNHETIDAFLEKLLRRKYPARRVEVINAAVTGYQVFQHTSYLLAELLDYSPDLVVFFDGYNDHFTVNPHYDYYADNIYQFWKPRLQTPSFEGLIDYGALLLSNWSGFARGYYAWKKQYDSSRNRKRKKMSSHDPLYDSDRLAAEHRMAARRQFLRSVSVNLLLLRHFSIDSIVCLQPGLPLREPGLCSEAENGFDDIVPGKLKKALYPVVADELAAVARQYGAAFVDMIPVFNDPQLQGRQLFIDYCHLTAAGSRAVAEALLPPVEAVLEKRIVSGDDGKQ